jgi:hypothetical protein
MSRNNNTKLIKLMAFAINIQLIVSPAAFAKNKKRDSRANTLADITNMATQVGGAAMQQMQQMQMQQMSQQQRMMMQSQYGLQPVDPSQVPPILSQSGCIVLPARANHPADKCESYDPQKAQMGYYNALMEVAGNNENDLSNYLTSGHERFTTQGVGCYEKALKSFTQALNSRIEALNKLEEALELEVANFNKLTEKDVLDLKRGNALLEGKPAELIKDMKFEDRFNDPQCASFVDNKTFRDQGKKGFRGIQEMLAQRVDTPQAGLTPAQLKGRQADIQREVREIAKQVARFSSDKKTTNVNLGAIGIRSKYIGSDNKGLQAIIAQTSTNANNELADMQRDLTKMMDDDDQKNIMQGILNDSLDVDNALFVYERKQKNSCLNNYLQSNFGGAQGLASKLEDPNVSAKANREADSAYKNSIAAILGDDEYTMEQKIEMIKKEEAKTGNSTYTFTTGKSVNINGKTIGASTRLRASDMLGIFTNNCTERFEKLANKQGKSPRSVVNGLRNFKTKVENLQKKFAAQVQENIVRDMLECPNEKNEGTGAMSCNGALDTNSSSFCLRTANVCAGNMQACKDKADKIVDTTRNEQKVIAQRYKGHVDNFKVALAQRFQGAKSVMEATARQLDGMYQMGSTYSVPLELDLSLVTDKFMKEEGIDASLMIEDPKKYMKAMKDNIKKLKDSVAASNKAILDGSPAGRDMASIDGADKASQYKGFKGEIKKYLDNYKSQQQEWAQIKNACLALINQHNQMIADQNQAQQEAVNERNSKVSNVCRKLQSFEHNPQGFCGEAASLGDEILEIAAVAGDSRAAAELKAFDNACNSFNSENGDNHFDNGSRRSNRRSVASVDSMKSYCEKNKNENIRGCDAISKVKSICDDEDDRLEKAAEAYCYVKEGEKNNFYLTTNKLKCQDNDQVVRRVSENEDVQNEFNNFFKNEKKDVQRSHVCWTETELAKDEKYKDAVAEVQEYIAQQQRSKAIADIGDLDVSFCDSTFAGEIGKNILPMAGEAIGRGLAGGDAWGLGQ